MTYQALARKWRPQDFSAIVGQAPVVTALRNAISESRIAQAYLFAGIRGVGKTTAARVFAKALNCERRGEQTDSGPRTDPCNECSTCAQIGKGSDLDVIEIDAATYSKVEQIRELTESLQYGPARDKYKVVVLDEIHRLSRQAFDALLKIVEEPPAHLVFIFATTEVETVPATILSRCQEFHFRRVPAAELTPYLRSICEAEEIVANDRALRLVARAGEGSVRDSVALLDQLATFGSGTVSEEDAIRLLGGLDFGFFHDLLGAMVDGDSAAVSQALISTEQSGWDPRRVHTQFLGYCRDALHLAVGANASQLDLPTEEADRLTILARETGYSNLLRLVHQLLRSDEILRRSEVPTLAVEIAWLKAAELPRLVGLEDLLAGAGGSAIRSTQPRDPEAATRVRRSSPPSAPTPASSGPAAAAKSKPTKPPAAKAEKPSKAPQPKEPKDLADTPPPRTATTPATPAAPPPPTARPAAPPTEPATARQGAKLAADPVTAFLEFVNHQKQPLAAHLRQAQRLTFSDGVLLIEVERGDSFIPPALQRTANSDVLNEAVKEIWGDDSRWRLVEVDSGPAQQKEIVEPKSEKKGSAAIDHPVVQSALDLFSGTIEAVERTGPDADGES